jgi:hypothetical protein
MKRPPKSSFTVHSEDRKTGTRSNVKYELRGLTIFSGRTATGVNLIWMKMETIFCGDASSNNKTVGKRSTVKRPDDVL